MGIIVNKENQENELTRRIDADLRAKLSGNSREDTEEPQTDFTEDTEYMKDYKKTGRFSWVWAILIFLAVLALIAIIFF